MASDLSHVPTEGMQRIHLRLLLEAGESLRQASEAFDAHDRTQSRAYQMTPEEQRQWVGVRLDCVGRLRGATDWLLGAMDRARASGALGQHDAEAEARLRLDHAERDGVAA